MAIDPWFVVKAAPNLAPLIELSRNVNDSMPSHVAKRIANLVNPGSKIVILGCTYKPDIDDLRESPIMDLLDLIKNDYNITIVDPFVAEYNVELYTATQDADLVMLGVHHNKFKEIDLARLAGATKNAVWLDTRNFFTKEEIEEAGFEYHLLGLSDAPKGILREAEREVAAVEE